MKNLSHADLFHSANRSCSIANHVHLYNNYNNVREQVFGLGIFGTLLLFIVTAYYSTSPFHADSYQTTTNVFGFKLTEPLFLLTLWVLYHIGSFALIASEDYIEFCEAEADKMFQEIVRISIYVALLIISLSRCRHLRATDFDLDVQSWELYMRNNERSCRKRFLCFLLNYLGPLLLILSFLPEILQSSKWARASLYDNNMCFADDRNYSLFTIQFGKVLVETFVVTVYALGPSGDQCTFYLRYVILSLCLLMNVVFLSLTFAGHHAFQITFMMIPRVPDAKIGLPLLTPVHAICVSLLGIFEPCRIGWRRRTLAHNE